MSDGQTIEKTGWFPSTTKPVRIGFYETHWLIGSLSVLRFWDGKAWHTDGQVCSRQDYTWRGLARLGGDHVADYVTEDSAQRRLIPHEVVRATADGATPSRAWREHLGLKQIEVAARMDISQPAYSQQEAKGRLQESSREKIAAALGITADQLDF
ncbi:helix-turn-helix domain-containing protein [Paraburkholderia sp. 1N]|uniref:Helix-turn-helix domain-containing protein n=1 Tax=Paraburkholderia solitsugae TaxID=2675748 RepID=A0ABX2BV14_9BURK|nr:helix-turn-helix domain-containing protein [Paraburkholderia solitsugae]